MLIPDQLTPRSHFATYVSHFIDIFICIHKSLHFQFSTLSQHITHTFPCVIVFHHQFYILFAFLTDLNGLMDARPSDDISLSVKAPNRAQLFMDDEQLSLSPPYQHISHIFHIAHTSHISHVVRVAPIAPVAQSFPLQPPFQTLFSEPSTSPLSSLCVK